MLCHYALHYWERYPQDSDAADWRTYDVIDKSQAQCLHNVDNYNKGTDKVVYQCINQWLIVTNSKITTIHEYQTNVNLVTIVYECSDYCQVTPLGCYIIVTC